MRFNEPKILSKEADNQNGLSGVKYSYADGSVGFKAHASKNLIVTSPDNTVTTYNSELIRIKEETQDYTFEYHEDGDSVKKAIFYNPENKNINAEKIFDVNGTKISETKYKYYENSSQASSISVETDKESQIAHYDINGKEISRTTYTYYAGKNKVASLTIKKGDETKFVHYDINGNDDTALYLAIKRVAKRRVDKDKKLNKESVSKNTESEHLNETALTTFVSKQFKNLQNLWDVGSEILINSRKNFNK